MFNKKFALIGSLVVGGATALIFALQAHAASLFVTTTYYSDASQSAIVGEKFRNCDETDDTWGSSSIYYTRTVEVCLPKGSY